MTVRAALALVLATAALESAALDTAGGAAPPAPRPRGEQHGLVILDNASSTLGIDPVRFDHAVHRPLYTCRVCHVDLGFALKAGETQVSAASNEAGSHCGACHDGRKRRADRTIFAACSGWPRPDAARGCTRCHAAVAGGPSPGHEAVKRRLPLDGDGFIDWQEAERRGLIRPDDTVEGVTVKRPAMRMDREVTRAAVGSWLKPVTFSHAKHAHWNGCGMCHPEPFPMKGAALVRYRMTDIYAGRYCGLCHVNVAFPVGACHRCHVEERRRP